MNALAILLEYGAFQNFDRMVPLKMGEFRWIGRQIWFSLPYIHHFLSILEIPFIDCPVFVVIE